MQPTSKLLEIDVPPYRLSGVVYCAQLNDRAHWALLGDTAREAPYKAPAEAPVLALKARNTLASSGASIQAPREGEALRVGATLAVLIGRPACRVPEADALDWVAGYGVVADLSVPHASHYRPSVRLKARDGSCVLGSGFVPAATVPRPDDLRVRIDIGGHAAQETTTGERVRGVARLIADVTEFMTLEAGDLLLLGESAGAPEARTGDRVSVNIEGVGRLEFSLVSEGAAA